METANTKVKIGYRSGVKKEVNSVCGELLNSKTQMFMYYQLLIRRFPETFSETVSQRRNIPNYTEPSESVSRLETLYIPLVQFIYSTRSLIPPKI